MDFRKFILCGMCLCTFLGFSQRITIMLDAGHGGTDPGHEAVFKNHLDEKELTLKISTKLGTYLSDLLSNVDVVYTRSQDTFPSLDKRVEMANAAKVDYFVSIHLNGADNAAIHGTEVHVNSFKSTKAVSLAKAIDKEFKERAGRKSRGIKDSKDREHSLQVLKYTSMTSVLVECGFLTNQAEANYVNTDYGQDIIASALFRGIRSFLKKTHPEIAFSAPSKDEKTNTESTQKGYYSVQLMSSKEWIDTESACFTTLKQTVERVQVAQSGYRYKYFAGKFDDKEKANSALEKIKLQGFKDAFVVERKN